MVSIRIFQHTYNLEPWETSNFKLGCFHKKNLKIFANLTIFFHNGNLVFKLKICASNCPFKMKMLDLILFKLLLFKHL